MRTTWVLCALLTAGILSAPAAECGDYVTIVPSNPTPPDTPQRPVTGWSVFAHAQNIARTYAYGRSLAAARQQANDIATAYYAGGKTDHIIVSVVCDGCRVTSEGVRPIREIGAVLNGTGSSFAIALDQAIQPVVLPGGSSIIGQIAYEVNGGAVTSTPVALSEYDAAVARGWALIDGQTQEQLDRLGHEENRYRTEASEARDDTARKQAQEKAKKAADEAEETRKEANKREQDRADAHRERESILNGRATREQKESYTRRWDEFLKASNTARCARGADSCNACPICRTALYPELNIWEESVMKDRISKAEVAFPGIQGQLLEFNRAVTPADIQDAVRKLEKQVDRTRGSGSQ